MTPTPKKDLRRYERTRAAGFILRYETKLQAAVRSNPTTRDAALATKVIESMQAIRAEIMGSMTPYINPIRREPGDFSMEEIEKAQELMAEEDNPFEES